MANNRKKYTENENIHLLSQTNGLCPLSCDKPLLRQKNGKKYKAYQLAHIYPLNPILEEVKLLENEERLSVDPNDEDNIIPLCNNCHSKFDNPRTVEEYRELLSIKKKLIDAEATKRLWQNYSIEQKIIEILDFLATDPEDPNQNGGDIVFNPTIADEKFDRSVPPLDKRKIKANITNYFIIVKRKLALMDQETPGVPDLISSQVKVFYKKLMAEGSSKIDAYNSVVDWLKNKTRTSSREPVEIVVSFFVQNCEVLD